MSFFSISGQQIPQEERRSISQTFTVHKAIIRRTRNVFYNKKKNNKGSALKKRLLQFLMRKVSGYDDG